MIHTAQLATIAAQEAQRRRPVLADKVNRGTLDQDRFERDCAIWARIPAYWSHADNFALDGHWPEAVKATLSAARGAIRADQPRATGLLTLARATCARARHMNVPDASAQYHIALTFPPAEERKAA